jgi:predicted dienelactone hydrolase
VESGFSRIERVSYVESGFGRIQETLMSRRRQLLALLALLVAPAALAQSNRIDVVTPMAPDLAAIGAFAVGARTITAVDRDRPDVLNTKPGGPLVRRDRTYTIETWYPAVRAAGQAPGTEYRTLARDPARPTTLRGLATRDAVADKAGAPYPLVILSHGYPGNRYLLAHLGENLASKGFVVVSVDHPESTYDDRKGFASTLYNRPYDQLFVLDELDRLSRAGSGSFLAGLADASRTAIVGYSMGGYGLLNVIGAGFSDASVEARNAPPNRLLFERAASNPAYPKRADPRIKAAIAIAPWGFQSGAWTAEAIRAIATPLLLVAGSADDVSGYEKGTRAVFVGATSADRWLLTFLNGSHNVAAPIPAPAEAYAYSDTLEQFPFMHYADPVWDSVRSNNVLQHFATAFLSLHLKGQREMQAFLDVVPRGQDAVYSVDAEGKFRPDHTYWRGFKPRTAAGLTFEHLPAGK